MENIAPPLRLLWMVKKALDKGASVRHGVGEYLKAEPDSWTDQVLAWFLKFQRGIETQSVICAQKTPYREQVLLLVERGMRGDTIYSNLVQLEIEMTGQAEQQIEEFVSRVPYLLLIPLACFLFPACLVLMLGPLILQLTQSF